VADEGEEREEEELGNQEEEQEEEAGDPVAFVNSFHEQIEKSMALIEQVRPCAAVVAASHMLLLLEDAVGEVWAARAWPS
jgi:hypothetical protein